MSPEAIIAIIGSIAALITSMVNAGNSATKVELEDLRRRVDELRNELQTERDSNDKLRTQITAAEDAVVTAAAEKRELRLQIEKMKEEYYSMQKQIKQYQNAMKEKDEKIKSLEFRVSEMEELLKKHNICSGGCADATD